MSSSLNESRNDPRLILLHPEDDVATAAVPLEAGTSVTLGGRTVHLRVAIRRGHKVAVRRIETGAKVLKYGAPIGSATGPIDVGDWVHHHNLASDYLPTLERGGGGEH